jgi:signal transduction histidine kinase
MGWWSAVLRQVGRPLSEALDTLARHDVAVQRDWRHKLERLGFAPEERRALSALRLAGYRPQVRTGRFDDYAAALEAAGQALARRGMPEARAVAALSAQLESMLSVLVREGGSDFAPAAARFAFAGGLSLMEGYARARTSSWRSFGEEERHRFSRDLHDEIGHQLMVLKLYLGTISGEMEKGRPAQIRDKLDEATDLVSQTIQSVRRLILDLGPVALEGVGFLPAVKLYARQFSARTGVKVLVRGRSFPGPLPSGHETALYRLLQGALSNVLKHAHARWVTVTVRPSKGGGVALTIEDDGVGFDTAAPRQAFGLAAMRDRVTSFGGRLRLESQPAGARRGRHGTRIEVELPLVGPF